LPDPRALRGDRRVVARAGGTGRRGSRPGARQRPSGRGWRTPVITSRLAAALSVIVVLSGCGALERLAVGPNYQRPPTDLPKEFRGHSISADPTSIADLPWWSVFGDPALRALVREALRNNYDLKTAVARVEQFRAQVGVTASQLYPQVGYQG